jgi:hypothetical protein
MRITLLVLIQFFFINSAKSQNIDPYLSAIRIDSLVKTVRELSGEDPVIINGVSSNLTNRNNAIGKKLATDYIKKRLERYNLTTTEQNYSSVGRNIIATQTGTKYPESIYIICAHYDSVNSYCADDNASGVATIIEAARILSKNCFDYTIIYALWDEEEIGHLGSKYYAQQAKNSNQNILGVINLEMLGYDSNNDKKFDIHTNNDSRSLTLKDNLLNIVKSSNLTLVPNVINPGTTRSDHASFWSQNYGAVVISEAFFGGDGNPYYHSASDRISSFNIPYYQELSKLSVGILATLANPCAPLSIEEQSANDQILIYPNPTTSQLSIITTLEINEIEILDTGGKTIMKSDQNTKIINTSNLSNGIYLIKIISGRKTITKQFIKQ